jgi:hypothetical protein
LNSLFFVRHEPPNEISNFVGGGVQGEVAGIEDVNLGLGNVAAV